MAKKRIPIALMDILAAIEEIETYTEGLKFGGYMKDGRTRRSVERCLEIVSEASRKIPEAAKAEHPEIEWHAIRAIGNVLRHEYGAVDDKLIWRIVIRNLPELKTTVRTLVSEATEIRAKSKNKS